MENEKLIKILITGATGFIGSLLIKKILNEYVLGKNVVVFALVRDLRKAQKMWECYNVNFIVSDILELNVKTFEIGFDYIIHCANTTKSKEMVTYPVETSMTIVNGTKNILELARKFCVKSMVYISSMEVYGQITDDERICEKHLSNIDVLSERSCYPIGKCMAENLCYSYYKEYGVDVKIARLSQVFGKGILPNENRIFAQIAKSVINNKNIVLHTDGSAMGNYCESTDAANAIFLILKKGKASEAYNVVNESNTMTIREMAEMVIHNIAKDSIKLEFDISDSNKYGYAKKTNLKLSSEKLRSLGWKCNKNIIDMYNDMIAYMKRNNITDTDN